MSRMMLHGLGDCTPELNCGCLTRPVTSLEELKQRLEVEEFFDYQLETFAAWQQELEDNLKARMCLYHRTGAGKTITSLICMAIAGETKVLVIAPPATHSQWADSIVRRAAHFGVNDSGKLIAIRPAV